jgi:hypothetical protein
MSRRKRYTRNLGRSPAERVPTRGRGSRYVRFAHAADPYGVFSYAKDARPSLAALDCDELDHLLQWFADHLDEPESMVPVRAASDDDRAVCWFRASARRHVTHARRLSILVRRAGIPIVERRSDDVPGLICSEDAHQLAVASFWEPRPS